MARKQKTIHYIYKTTNLLNGKYYIGMHSTCNLEDVYMGSGRRLRASIRKYGKENFKVEILEFFDTRELLIEAEKKAITSDMITDNNCMNIMSGGTGGYISEEHYKKTSKIGGDIHANKMLNDINYRNKTISIASKTILKCWSDGKFKNNKRFTGLSHTEETKKLLREQKNNYGLGETNSQYGTCWITKDGVNKKIKKEEIDKWVKEGWSKGRK